MAELALRCGDCDGAGNCFGAPYVMEALAEDWMTAGAFAHPSFLNEEHFRNIKRTCRRAFSCEANPSPHAIDLIVFAGPLLMLCSGKTRVSISRAYSDTMRQRKTSASPPRTAERRSTCSSSTRKTTPCSSSEASHTGSQLVRILVSPNSVSTATPL